MRIRKKPWAEKELAESQKVIPVPADMKGKWMPYFKNPNPIHIEIGSGKGRFIVDTAKANPDINYISIEKEPHAIATGVRESKLLDLSLAFIIEDVKNLSDYFEIGEIKRLYINFCDPWQNRKKWAKRRLTHKNFLDMYKNLFGETGEIFFKTDNKELFDFSLEQFTENGWALRNVSYDLHNSGYEGNIMTEYEEKFSGLGQPIYRCEAYY